MQIERLYLRVDILLTCGKDLHDPIHSLSGEDWTHKTSCGKDLHDPIHSLSGEDWTHKTSLTPTLFIYLPVASQESEQSCICVFYWILELF